ncbi:MAG: response regulator, partial [Deltaproteobacteria bacterium]|nr:response regulator [Deltaproteobacteria bacterium]
MPNPKIMVVEDEAVVAMEIEERLSNLGYEISGIFARGEQALEQVGQIKPDLILMDIKLAGEMNGIQAAKVILQRYDIPVVYLTAHSDENTLTQALGALPLGYVVKPFSEAELHATIEVSLTKHRSDKQAREMAQWFSRATDVIGGAVILTEENGIVRHMNSLAEIMTGWNRDEATGRPVTEILRLKRPDNGETVEQFRLLRSGESFVASSADCILLSRDGSETHIEIAILPSGDSDEHLCNVIFAFQEKTDRPAAAQDWVSVTANLVINAELSRSEGEYEIALSFYERALAVLENHVERDSSQVRALLEDLVQAYKRVGKERDAQIFSIRASRIRSHQNAARPMFANRSSDRASA